MTGPLFPENYSKVWIRGRFITMAGVAVRGKLTLAPTVTGGGLVNRSLKLIMSTAAFSADTDNDGYVALHVPATNDPDITPINFTYSVTTPIGQKFSIVVPYDTTPLNSVGDPLHGQPVIELIDMVPVGSSGGVGQLLRGIGIQSMVDNGAGSLLITYTDGATSTVAMPDTVMGPAGPVGPLGPIGPAGPAGPAGVLVDGQPADQVDIDSSPVGLADLHDVTTAGAAVGDVVTFTQVGASATFGKATPYGLGAYTVTGVDLTGAVDASAAIQAGIDAQAAKANGGTVYLPAGRYRINTTLVPKNKVTIIGAGRNLTRLLPYGAIACFERIGSTSDPLDDAHFADFTIDGTNQTGPYATRIKGLYIQWLRRCSFNRLRVYNTGATGVGTDHHVDCEMNDIIADSCGRLNDGTQGGGAGIGIGTGGWLTGAETLVISGCVTKNNKRCGLFFETQNGGLLIGTRVIGHYSENNGEHGLADAGTQGLVVSGGASVGNGKSGFAMYAGTIDPGKPGTYGLVTGMTLLNNVENGVHYDATIRETANPRYTIRGCKIRGNTGHGVYIAAGATADPQGLVIDDNEIHSNQKAGIYVTSAGATVTDLSLESNRIFANGLNTAVAERQGIRIQCSTTRLRVTGNKAWDHQATKTQTHGLQLAGGTTATDAYFDGNDFRSNLTGSANISGTIGSGSVIGPNNAGWTVAAGTPEAVVKAPIGTVYRRTDGGAGTSMYVKESGSAETGWVAK